MSASIRNVVENCLDKTGRLSVREDVLGVYGTDNPRNRSVLAQMDRIQNMPFVKVALVTISGANPLIQRDLDNGNDIYQAECDAWIYPTDSITEVNDGLLVFNQDDCRSSGHSVSDDEDELFDLGRNLGANIVGYYVNNTNLGGCAAHPPGRRGFWSGPNGSQWTWAHELTHVVGDNAHLDTDNNCDLTNLMTGCGTGNITVNLPNLNSTQCDRIHDDDDVEEC